MLLAALAAQAALTLLLVLRRPVLRSAAMTITISASGITLDGPLVAGEKVSVTVSGLSLAAEDKPTLALLARFPDALLASVELAEDAETPGTWTGELDTATKQTALFFATARADERRDAALELVAGRVSLARLTVPMANSALCPKPDGSPFASPVYVPVPGPPGQGGDPYDQPPEMDGEASAGVSDEYARGDHRHPTDTTRQAVIEDLAAIRYGAAAGATAVQPSALSAYRTAAAQDAIDAGKLDATGLTNNHGQLVAGDFITGYSYSFPGGKYISAPENHGAALTDEDITDSGSALGAALAAKADTADIPSASSSAPAMDGVAAAGSSTDYARADHVHPTDTSRASSASLAPAFSSSSTYAVGDYCTHEGLLYKCTTAVSTAGAWDSTKWKSVSVYTNVPYDAELEYITLGGAYIDSGISCANASTSPIGFSATLKLEELIGSWDGVILTGQQSCVSLDKGSGPSGQIGISIGGTMKSCATQSDAMSGFNTFALVEKEVFYNGTSKGINGGTPTSYNYTFTIGRGRGTDGSIKNGYSISYSSFKITSGAETVRDFIPVRKSGVGYFYDKVSGALFGAASGSTSAIGLGPDKSGALPLMDGTAAHGSSEEMSPIDHVHPTDTSRAADSDVLHKTGNETKTGKLTIKTTAVSLNGSSSAPFAEIGENGLHVAAAGTDSNPSAVLVGHDTITVRPNVNYQSSDNDKVYSFPATGGTFAVASQIPAAPVQSNWNESDSASLSYIQNKPTNVSAFNNDSGYLTATTARYAFNSVTTSTSGTSASVTCADLSINDFTVATGITSLTITPPAAVTGRARDFFCRVTLTDSSLPTVTLSGGTIDIGSTEVAGMTQGVNLLMFTEIASGHWLASRRSAS